MNRIDEIANRINAVKVQVANDQPATDQPTWADVQHLLSCIEGRGVGDAKASYSTAHSTRYSMTHAVHPDIVVLWFLAMKSHWFEDPDNMFFGMREQAKEYLYKWVETGELADDSTTLEIAAKMKFKEWLESSWIAVTPTPTPPIHCPNCHHLMVSGTSQWQRCVNPSCGYMEGVGSSGGGERCAEQCPVTCADFPMNDCKEAHRCVLDEGHPFDPMYGQIHRFVTHMMPVKPRSQCVFPAPLEAEKKL